MKTPNSSRAVGSIHTVDPSSGCNIVTDTLGSPTQMSDPPTLLNSVLQESYKLLNSVKVQRRNFTIENYTKQSVGQSRSGKECDKQITR
mmetsp:Transcript_57283/g.119771  ORF Transcript_57283/g.119771 Transcript_57283/m.119771 type:complete len:89 (-) Transcript_57283:8-274(-)